MTDSHVDLADFGFQNVPRGEKRKLVAAVFDRVAPRYDLMNDVMSLGIHRAWKAIFVTALDPRPSRTLLDLASGTGDIVRGWLQHGGGLALASDINASMLRVGRERVSTSAVAAEYAPLAANAEQLPLPDRSVDVVAMAFGLRNCTDKPAVLSEAYRVLRPGGRFCCLEFSRLQVAAVERFYDTWSFAVLPRLGKLIAGDAESYRYLAESIRMFPDQEALADMFRAAGLSRITYKNLSGGIVAIHQGWRL